MYAAVADPRLVVAQSKEPLEVAVVELRVAGDDRVAGQVALGVVVLVPLLGLPAQQPPRRDAQVDG